MSHECIVPDCTRRGLEILPTVVLCPYHRKVGYHELCRIYHEEQDARAKAKAEREKNAEIHRIARQEAGMSSPPQPMLKGWGDEISGGQFESNRRKH